MASSSTLLVTTVKNEGPNILEWVAHHRLCGFDKIMVFQNDSTDFTARALKVMDRLGIVELRQNGSRNPQISAYRAASESVAFQEAEWCMALDGDEFLNVHVGTNRIQDVLSHVGDVDQVHLNWRLFGSAGETGLALELVTRRFTRAEAIAGSEHKLRGFKTVFRPRAFSRIGIHRPRHPVGRSPRASNGSGLMESEFVTGNWRSNDPGGMRLAQVNHYAIRDAASFILKTRRGRAHQVHNALDDDYWRVHNRNDVEDRRLADRSEAVWKEMMRLDALSDGRLMLLRRKAFRVWQRTFRRILSDPETHRFYEALAQDSEKEKSPA